MSMNKVTFPYKPEKYMQVSKNLSRSALPTVHQFRWLKSQGVTDVVDLTKPQIEHKPFNEKEVVERLGMRYHNIPIYTSSPQEEQVGKFLDIVEDVSQNNGKVHLHCMEGVDRTGMYALIYKTLNNIDTFKNNVKEMYSMGFHYYCYEDIIPWAEKYINKFSKK